MWRNKPDYLTIHAASDVLLLSEIHCHDKVMGTRKYSIAFRVATGCLAAVLEIALAPHLALFAAHVDHLSRVFLPSESKGM
jgi:hypothetical protein